MKFLIFLLFFFLPSSLVLSLDPDVDRTMSQIITAKGYPCEEHFVTTPDGYILRLFRIPYGRNVTDTSSARPPILLQHGLLDSSFTWIVNEPTESLPYILADAGYDVFMGNNRGNLYSINSTTLSTDSEAFWAFSWDQMALLDLPTMVDYVKTETGFDTIAYVGHSEGTTQAFAGLSSLPDLYKSLSMFVGLGPVITVGNETNVVLRELANLDVGKFLEYFGVKQFLPNEALLDEIFPWFCAICDECCADVIELICGPHYGAMNDSRMDVVASHEPGGTSVQNGMHWSQMVESGLFQAYDYGNSSANMKHYNSSTPPIYDIGLYPPSLPTILFSGGLDELADPKDVARLVKLLPNVTYWKELPDYAHLDYVWALSASQDIYPKILDFLKEFPPSK